ncbi:8-oxo-dGTP diphosphatase [Lentibacillus sp. JNUCC-1]|uniref:GNAT family N-acetyltransferase n=1 Tax=Lentibacillus sp. JNUCC-1 TaxID=2654513 RepID=UPI0012E7D9AB|nr:GNAT family N-acetyltransferase [Lentibacillus sp. JNUCC-1]MUV36469.1 8-oxo-dGTP diphosphatase [Lentibacillus sp. JNUCC-1]
MSKVIMTENGLKLRLFQTSDAADVAHMCNNYNIYRNTLHLPYPYSEEDAIAWIKPQLEHFKNGRAYEFAITDQDSGKIYGAIGVSHNQQAQNGEVGYWIGEEYWGNGYATGALRAIMQFAFEEKHYHKVYARCFGSNPASGRVLKKAGMHREGILIDHVTKDERYEDLIYYGLLRDQYEDLSESP